MHLSSEHARAFIDMLEHVYMWGYLVRELRHVNETRALLSSAFTVQSHYSHVILLINIHSLP